MKENYEKLIIEIIILDSDDIITESTGGGSDEGED